MGGQHLMGRYPSGLFLMGQMESHSVIYDPTVGFTTQVNPNPKTQVTRSFFKLENPGLESLQT